MKLIGMLMLACILISACSSIQADAKQSACRSNMKNIATAENMYFARLRDGFTDAAGLESADILGNATSLTCPDHGGSYDIDYSDDEFTIQCSNNPCHGSIEGNEQGSVCSWNN